MKKKAIWSLMLCLAIAVCGLAFAQAAEETGELTGAEIEAFVAQIREKAAAGERLTNPAGEDALAEDGYAYQYDFGIVYADQNEWTENTRINAFVVMDSDIPGPRGITVDWTVNAVMNTIACDNAEMFGNYEEAVLYLHGDAENGYRYGRVWRDGQRISAMEFGEVNPESGKRAVLTLGVSGDGVNDVRVDGLADDFSREDAAAQYAEMEELTRQFFYSRVRRSVIGTDLEMFNESDLDFSTLSYLTAEPATFGDNVENMLIDNEDGTWLRRVDGDGFEAVFSCDSAGENATLLSYTILSPDLEGPRCVRLGDLFHEDFTRFRSGEGGMDDAGMTEVLYGTVGTAPYGLAEYGDGSEMTLRYVTKTLGGPDVELILRYQETALSEITLHTVEEDE